MITTKCMECGELIELKSKYGWTEKDQDKDNVICQGCDEVEEFLWNLEEKEGK